MSIILLLALSSGSSHTALSPCVFPACMCVCLTVNSCFLLIHLWEFEESMTCVCIPSERQYISSCNHLEILKF